MSEVGAVGMLRTEARCSHCVEMQLKFLLFLHSICVLPGPYRFRWSICRTQIATISNLPQVMTVEEDGGSVRS